MATDSRGALSSRRRFVRDVGIRSIVVLEGCGRLSLREQPAKVRRVGVLTYGTPTASERDNAALQQGLRELGYNDRNLSLEYRGAEWQAEWLLGLAAELVGLNIEIIVAMGGMWRARPCRPPRRPRSCSRRVVIRCLD